VTYDEPNQKRELLWTALILGIFLLIAGIAGLGQPFVGSSIIEGRNTVIFGSAAGIGLVATFLSFWLLSARMRPEQQSQIESVVDSKEGDESVDPFAKICGYATAALLLGATLIYWFNGVH